jgi:hypothetical protein
MCIFALCLMHPRVIVSLKVFTVPLMLQALNFSIACHIHSHPSSSCVAFMLLLFCCKLEKSILAKLSVNFRKVSKCLMFYSYLNYSMLNVPESFQHVLSLFSFRFIHASNMLFMMLKAFMDLYTTKLANDIQSITPR